MSSQQFDEDLLQFVQEIGIHPDWVKVLHDYLLPWYKSNISELEADLREYRMPIIPEKSKILLALSRCPPQDIKVVVLGHDPIPDKSLATGFAFSFPEGAMVDENVGQRKLEFMKGESVRRLHDVLVDAGYLERGANYDCCHEVWADRGVLLLNASLTYSKGQEHFLMWEEFVLVLLFRMSFYNKQKRLFFLCWGTNARDIGKQLYEALEKHWYPALKISDDHHNREIDDWARIVVFVGDHPTYPKDDNKFELQAKIQFQTIKQLYPDLFTLEKHSHAPPL